MHIENSKVGNVIAADRPHILRSCAVALCDGQGRDSGDDS